MTDKQILAAKKMVALSQATGSLDGIQAKAMIAAGYSPNTARAPTKLTKSKAWPELLEKYLPDDKLLAKHDEALEATKWNDFTGEREEDHTTRLKAVDMAYKVKKRYVDNAIYNVNNLKVEFIQPDEVQTNEVAVDSQPGQTQV